jgi:phage gpG-like protein
VFTSKKSGKLWAVIEGGYAAYKQAAYPGDSGVNLSATGAMLRSLTILSVDEATLTVVIGFTRTDEAVKALYHDQLGAGKSRAIRHFMGLTDTEQTELGEMGADGIALKI